MSNQQRTSLIDPRSINEFSPAELANYRVHLAKLKDLTLSDAQHSESRNVIDTLFRRGPHGVAKGLEDAFKKLEDRVLALETALGLPQPEADTRQESTPNGTETSNPPATKRGRGRPKGSKNKAASPDTAPNLGETGDSTATATEITPAADSKTLASSASTPPATKESVTEGVETSTPETPPSNGGESDPLGLGSL